MINKKFSYHVKAKNIKEVNKFFENQERTLELIDAKALAIELGVSIKTIYGWSYRGLIKPYKVGPHLIRFDRGEIRQWIYQNGGDSDGN